MHVETTAEVLRPAEAEIKQTAQPIPPVYGPCTFGGSEPSGGHGTCDDDVHEEGGVLATSEPISIDVADGDTATVQVEPKSDPEAVNFWWQEKSTETTGKLSTGKVDEFIKFEPYECYDLFNVNCLQPTYYT